MGHKNDKELDLGNWIVQDQLAYAGANGAMLGLWGFDPHSNGE